MALNFNNNNSSAPKQAAYTTSGFLDLLQVAFIVLKLCKVIDWSWFWVLFPTILIVGILLLFLIVAFSIIGISKFKERTETAKKKRAAQKEHDERVKKAAAIYETKMRGYADIKLTPEMLNEDYPHTLNTLLSNLSVNLGLKKYYSFKSYSKPQKPEESNLRGFSGEIMNDQLDTIAVLPFILFEINRETYLRIFTSPLKWADISLITRNDEGTLVEVPLKFTPVKPVDAEGNIIAGDTDGDRNNGGANGTPHGFA